MLEKLFALFVAFIDSHDIMKNKRTYVLKGVKKFGRYTMGQCLFAAGEYHSFLYKSIKTAAKLRRLPRARFCKSTYRYAVRNVFGL